MISRASSTKSGSAKDLPIGRPFANIKVLAIPPPTINSSTLLANAFKMVNLDDTLEPATIATSGRLGLANARLKASSSAAINGPAQAIGANFATPLVVASARWAVPNASFTYTSQSAAIFFDSSSEFFFSPTFKRQFSSKTNSPGLSSNPPSTQLLTSGTLRLSNSAIRCATGARLSSDLNWPSVGRPRWEVTMTAAPASKHICTAGMEALIRVSSVILPASSCGTFRSARIKTRFPLRRPAAAKSLKRLTLNKVSGIGGYSVK